jgi:hypothetical protein
VHEGCRYAITNQINPTLKVGGNAAGLIDSVKWVVEANASGMLGTPTATGLSSNAAYNNLIHVNFYTPGTSLVNALTPVCGSATANQGGNLVEVAVEGYQHQQITATLFRDPTSLSFVARSSDKLEGNPGSPVPSALTCP